MILGLPIDPLPNPPLCKGRGTPARTSPSPGKGEGRGGGLWGDSILNHLALEWRRIEALFVALGARKQKGGGSRVAFLLNGVRADFHRPHPGKEAKRYQVRAAREFLQLAGVVA